MTHTTPHPPPPPPFPPALAFHPALALFILSPKYPSSLDANIFHTIAQNLLHPQPCSGVSPFPSSQQDCQTSASTTLAPTPSHLPHNSYQLTTCSCLFLLPLQSSSPGLAGSRWNSSCHTPYISLLYFRLFISKHMCLPISLPQNFRNSFFLQPLLFFVEFQTSSSQHPPNPRGHLYVWAFSFCFLQKW